VTHGPRTYDCTDERLAELLTDWRNGRSKNDIERVEFNDPASHGKGITAAWRDRLGVESEKRHPLALEVDRLRLLLIEHGIDPDEGDRQ
jgi:hypothetical protein